PMWPSLDDDNGEHRARGRFPLGGSRVTILALAMGGTALLLGLFSFFSQVGLFSLSAGQAGSTPGPGLGAGGIATATPSASLTPWTAGGLKVVPATVTLGCDDATRVQVVVLANKGPESVQWKVTLPETSNGVAVDVSPSRGRLAPGASLAIHLQNRASDGARQGTLRFDTQHAGAGAPASLSYTAERCG